MEVYFILKCLMCMIITLNKIKGGSLMIYRTWQRGREAILAYVSQYQLYQTFFICFFFFFFGGGGGGGGGAEQKQCRVLELF